MRNLGRWLGLAAAMAVLSCSGPTPRAPLRNVVLIVVDTLRQDHLGAYGYPRETAPTFTRLAAEGVIWDGVSPTSWTKPAVASLLTGLHPVRHQTFGDKDALPGAARTLAERLGERGYDTFGITANGWLSRGAGFAQGFGTYYSMLDDLNGGAFASAEQLNAQLFPRLRKLVRPFFLYVQYLDPHAPYDPVRDYRGASLRGPLAERKRGVTIQELRMTEVLQRPRAQLQDATDLYDGEIRRVDDGIRALLGELRRLGLAEGTLLIVTSDHGEEMEEHGRMGHGQTLYEEVVRVPLLFHAPGVLPAGARLGNASLLDVVPTVLELLSAPAAAEELDGVSLAALMKGAPPHARSPIDAGGRERELLLQLDLDKAGCALALRGPRLKLVLSQLLRGKQLFDYRADPREQASRFRGGQEAATLAAMAERLSARYNADAARSLPRARIDNAGERLEAMAALGYIGAGSGAEERCIPRHVLPADAAPDGSPGWD
jgi:arylsulfatase A-like enzyme